MWEDRQLRNLVPLLCELISLRYWRKYSQTHSSYSLQRNSLAYQRKPLYRRDYYSKDSRFQVEREMPQKVELINENEEKWMETNGSPQEVGVIPMKSKRDSTFWSIGKGLIGSMDAQTSCRFLFLSNLSLFLSVSLFSLSLSSFSFSLSLFSISISLFSAVS